MNFRERGKKIFEGGVNQGKANPKRLSLNLHTMPKTETGHFQKWLFLAVLIFILIIIGVLLFF